MKRETGYIESIEGSYQFVFQSRAAANFTGFFHAHKGIELLYVEQGAGKVIVDQHMHEIEPGTLFVFQPFQLHRTQVAVSERSPYVRTIVTFEPEALESYIAPYPGLQQFLQHLRNNRLTSHMLGRAELGFLYPQLLDHFGSLWKAGRLPSEEHPLTVIQLLSALKAVWPQEDAPLRAGLAQRPLTYTERAMQWIERHYAEDVRLDDIARQLHLSKHYLSRTFKRDTGSGLSDYLLARRVRQACFLLTTGDMTIQDIAAEIGFGSASYFCKAFRKSVGVSPQQYRKRAGALFNRGGHIAGSV